MSNFTAEERPNGAEFRLTARACRAALTTAFSHTEVVGVRLSGSSAKAAQCVFAWELALETVLAEGRDKVVSSVVPGGI